MAATATTADNAYAGSISFSTPQYNPATGSAIGGGFNFDLPLATVAAFNSQALGFLTNNSQNNQAFLTARLNDTNKRVTGANERGFSLLQSGAETIKGINTSTTAALTGVQQSTQQFSIFRSLFAPKTPKQSGGCFITTAICKLDGKPDDCEELQCLRKFRDEYMLTDSDLAPLVAEYYELAPKIVAALSLLENEGAAEFALLRDQYLSRAIAAVQSGDHERALSEYVNMVQFAKQLAGF